MRKLRLLKMLMLYGTFTFIACDQGVKNNTSDFVLTDSAIAADTLEAVPSRSTPTVLISYDVKVKQYFSFMDSIINAYDSLVSYQLTEHLLVHANPWIIDSLESYDYYSRKEKGEFIEDQKETIALRKGRELLIPNETEVAPFQEMFSKTMIDVNIPEFRLRIIVDSIVKYTFPVRVGRNERKFLAMAGREISLQTPIGEGEIVRIEKNPTFINPSNNHHYYATRRDDGVYTKLPQIPWIEPSINGIRPGALIHPTTNPETLGKAYSNGCVGTPEGAAWRIYYYAPLGTKVRFRYDLDIVDESGDTLHLKDIYNRNGKTIPKLIAFFNEPISLEGNPSVRVGCNDIGICH